MKYITKILSVILIMGMLMSFSPIVSNAAVTKQKLPFKDEFSTDGYVPNETDGYTVGDNGAYKVVDGELAMISNTSGWMNQAHGGYKVATPLDLEFESCSSGTLVFETIIDASFYYNPGGFVTMYDADGDMVLRTKMESRSANATIINNLSKKTVNSVVRNVLNNDAWGSGTYTQNKSYGSKGVKIEVDFDKKVWRFYQSSSVSSSDVASNYKQLQYIADDENKTVVKEFPFMMDKTNVNISKVRIALAQINSSLRNLKVYKKLSTSQTETSYGMLLGETQQAGITVTPSTEKVGDLVWSSSDSSVATVSDTGLITATNLGSAVITAKSEFYGINYNYAVTVQDPATGIALDKEQASICEGDSVTLSVKSVPDNTTFRNLTWSSSDDNIAEVVDGVVTGIGKGSATITATAEGKNGQTLTATAVVKVIKPLTGLSISATETNLSVGEKTTFKAVASPSDASEVTKKWHSGNHYIATVDQNGTVTAVGEGITEIFVSASGFTASQSVTVTDNKDTSSVRKPSLISFYTPTGYSFYDIADMEWAQSAVYSAVEAGAINPDSETIFGAKRNIKRDEFVSVVVKTLGLATKQGSAENQEALKNFTDVPESNPYYAEIMKALELGIIQGVSETQFAPDADITRQDMSVVVTNAFKVASVKTDEGRLDFADKDSIAEYAQTSVRILSKMGIILGKGNNIFDPLANTTRAEVCVIVDRINAVR